MMDHSLEEQILNSIELFHYSYKFRESTFGIIVDSSETLESILPDIRVLQSSRIRTVIFCRADAMLEEHVKRWKQRGHNFEYLQIGQDHSPDEIPKRVVKLSMTSGEVPVIAFEDKETLSFTPCRFYDRAIQGAHFLGARKVFLPGPYAGLTVNGKFHSHPKPAEVHELIAGTAQLNLSREFLAYIAAKLLETKIELIVLEARVGTLYQEVFSHRGVGTLFAEEYPAQFRSALPSDVGDIALLMKPYIKIRQILAVTESQIFDTLDGYCVHTMNGQLVATAKLTDYGDCAEIGKICTLPRYQHKGRARALTEWIIHKAKQQGKRWVFSLSTQGRMFVFFRQLGFNEVPREDLPQAWKVGYDFQRPSRAFRLDLKHSPLPQTKE